jgi:hypothetical protein
MTEHALARGLVVPPERLGRGYRSEGRRAAWAIWLLILTSTIEVTALGVELLDRRMQSGELLSAAGVAEYQSHRDLFTLLEAVAIVATGIVFLRWLHLAHLNLRELGRTQLRCGSTMAVGVWFIPILNLWRPMQVIDEVLHTTDSDDSRPGLVRLWWLALIVAGLITRYTSGMALDTLEDLQKQNIFEVLALAFSAGAAAGAAVIVRTVTDRHEHQAGMLAPASSV